jgi:integrase
MAAFDEIGIERFLEVAAPHRYGPIFFLALYTGMRRSEILGLRWTAVDLNAKTVSVVETLQRILGKGMMTLQPKTGKSRRLVSLPPSAAALLSGLKIKQQEQRQSLGLAWQESDYVFCLPDGRPYFPDRVSLAFAEIIKETGLPHIRFHDLRHTHATMMMKQGVNPKVVSERLGHASVVITLDTYSHVLPGLQEEAALGFEEGLRKATEHRSSRPD